MSNIKRITLLGSGTSTGVPEPGCFCRVCLSNDPRDKRGRTSVLIETCEGKNVLLDCSPDFHRQAVLAGIDHLDAILLSHEHYDHIGGLDDLRTFAWFHGITIYSLPRIIMAIKHRLHYYFGSNRYMGTPDLSLVEIDSETPFELFGLHIQPVEILHAKLPILGFRIDDFVFFTDLKTIARNELEKAHGAKLFFVNALRATKPHPSHQTIEEALAMVKEVEAKQAVLIHLSHHAPLSCEFPSILPRNVVAGYDGITFDAIGDSFVHVSDEKIPLSEPQPYKFIDLGKVNYEVALNQQKQLFNEALEIKKAGGVPMNTLLFCEHEPVFTLGKHGNSENMLLAEDVLKQRGINLYRIERGGDITFHGPGQITGYPIFDLEQFDMGIKDFIHTMEQCIIEALRVNGIKGERSVGAPGIWLDVAKTNERKICAMGVYASRYITMHGFALNVFTNLSYFDMINPCGFTNKGVTSLEKEMPAPTSMELVKQQVEEAFHRNFRNAMLKMQAKSKLQNAYN